MFGALQSIRKFVQTTDADTGQKIAQYVGIGGAMGSCSLIYSLVKISQFLQETTLLEDAQKIASFITRELIAADQKLDIMEGSAGAILGFLELYQQTGEGAVLEKAIACGQHLLSTSVSVEGVPHAKAWRTIDRKLLTGFSHGTAGISYALVRLYAVTQDIAYLEAAQEGIAYERSVFSHNAANWPDFRFLSESNGQPEFMVSWCHGAAGIGLARLGGLSILQTDTIDEDVQIALETTEKYSLQDIDHLCCGNFGRLEMQLMAAQKLSRPELREEVAQKAAWVISRAEKSGGYQLFPQLPNSVFMPSFFQGTAGIGYQLLRLAFPEVLPSVLLWQ